MKQTLLIFIEETIKKADNRNYLDGDIESQMGGAQYWQNKEITEKGEVDNRNIKINKYQDDAKMFADGVTGNSNEMYQYGISSLITDRARVYKGGSWKDRAYWLISRKQKILDETQSTDAIGFRCAMDRLGSQTSKSKNNQRKKLITIKKEDNSKVLKSKKHPIRLLMGFFSK